MFDDLNLHVGQTVIGQLFCTDCIDAQIVVRSPMMMQLRQTFHDLGQVFEQTESVLGISRQVFQETQGTSLLKDKDGITFGTRLHCDRIHEKTLQGVEQSLRLTKLFHVTSFGSIFGLHLFDMIA